VVADRKGGHRVRLTATYGRDSATTYEFDSQDLVWSPGGGRLAFAAKPWPEQGAMLCLINGDDSGRRCLESITGNIVGAIAWSPRGDRVAFSLGQPQQLDRMGTRRTHDAGAANPPLGR